MSLSIREIVYYIAELQALGHSKAELLEYARTVETNDYRAQYLLILADRVSIIVFDCAA